MTWAELRDALQCRHLSGRHWSNGEWPHIYEFACNDCAFWWTNTVVTTRPPQWDWADWLIDHWLDPYHAFADCIKREDDLPCKECREYAMDAVGAPRRS